MKSNNKHNKSGFKTPQNYFEGFDDRLFDSLNLEAKSILPKQTGFNTPKPYFNEIDHQILTQIDTKTRKVIPLFSAKKLIKYASSIAAILLLGYALINTKSETTIHDIEYASLEQYLTSNDLNYDTNDYADFYEISNIELDDISEYNIENEQLLDYISEEMDSENYLENL